MSTPQPTSEKNMATHDSTDPPPMPGNLSSPDSTGPWTVATNIATDKARKAREEARDALEETRQNTSSVQRIEATLGASPNTALGIPGGGLLGGFAMLCSKVYGLAVAVEKLTTAFAADQASAEKRRASVNWVIAKAVGAFIVLAMGAAFVWAATLHH